MTFLCAIAPLDQSSTSLGWHPGDYYRTACPAFGDCGWSDKSLQFLGDPGTPMVAPFPVEVVSLRPFVVRGTVELPFLGSTPYDFRIYDAAPAVAAGARLDTGALLGRVAPGARGVKWSLWGPDPVFHRVEQQPFISALFAGLGLDIVGTAYPPVSGLRLTPGFGGRMLARTGGSADCPAGGVRGLEALFALGSVAPAGYVEPSSSVYDRFGASRQTNTAPPPPDVPAPASGGGGGLWALGVAAFVGGVAWIATRR